MKSLKGSINYPLETGKPPGESFHFEAHPGSGGFSLILCGKEAAETSSEGRYTLTFEGEIYNLRLLRGILIDLGNDLSEASSTEILLAAFQQWGMEFLRHLKGMYSIVIWDGIEGKLFIAKDEFSGKKLYYTFQKNYSDASASQFIFSSDIHDILDVDFITPALDMQSLHHYFTFGAIPEPFSIYQDVSSIPSAHVFTYENGSFKLNKYWGLPAYPSDETDLKNASTKLCQNLFDSVNLRHPELGERVFVITDQYSAALASIAESTANEEIRSLTVTYRDSASKAFSKRIKHSRPKHQIHFYDDNQLRNKFFRFIKESDEPSAVLFNEYLALEPVMQMGKSAVFGLGAQELFFGKEQLAHFQRIHTGERKGGPLSGSREKKANFNQLTRKMKLNPMNALDEYQEKGLFISEQMKYNMYTQSMVNHLAAPETPTQYLSKFAFYPTETDIFARLTRLDLEGQINHISLHTLENLAHNSFLNIQTPFLDVRMMEQVFPLNHEIKMVKRGGGFFHSIFRDFTVKVDSPAGTRHALMNHMLTIMKDEVLYVFKSPQSNLRRFFRDETLSQLYENHSSDRIAPQIIWNLFALSQWLTDHHFD